MQLGSSLVEAIEAFNDMTKLVALSRAMMSHEIQPMGRLKTNQRFNNSYVT